MDINAAEAARRLNQTRIWVTRSARKGLFEGAWQDLYSGAWHIPEQAVEAVRKSEKAKP